jgi:probable phosphoglycerate mutase
MSSDRTDIERLRETSKRLLRDARAGKPEALRLLVRTDREPLLADAQHAVATKLGFRSWPQMVAAAGQHPRFVSVDEPRTRVVLVRAGTRNNRGVIQQHTSSGLSTIGQEQATAVARRLATGEFGTVDAVMSSQRPSSIETAAIIAEATGIDAEEPTCDLCDVHPGDAEGLTHDEMFDRFGPNYDFVPNAETLVDAEARVGSAMRRLGERFFGRTVVAVTESHGIATSMGVFAGMPRDIAREIPHGSITVWSCLADGRDPRRVDKWNLDRFIDRSHVSM